jgi:alkanesulfonate monooxygenase SsuD/methylene tetrahydromethanopterin reductase-like flavin-dependent oxidoreductase (luciferase family)
LIKALVPTVTRRACWAASWAASCPASTVFAGPFTPALLPEEVLPVEISVLVLPDRHPPSAFLADVREAEQGGVRAVWTYDHLVWPLLKDGPWYGSVPLMAAAAITTSHVRIGIQVATPNFRHPVPFAKELMTLDQLSGGRLEVGLGAGSEGPDAAVLGDPPTSRRERTDRFVEWISLLDQLLREPVTTVRGRRFSAIGAHQLPGCVQQPRVPFTVAAAGPRALRVAGEYGESWVTYGAWGPRVQPDEWFKELGEQSRRLSESLEQSGRAKGSLRRIAQVSLDARWLFESPGRYSDALGRLAELDFNEVSVHWPRPDGLGVPAGALAGVFAAHGL